MLNNMYCFLLLLLINLSCVTPSKDFIDTSNIRAVVDIGSGSTKLIVAELDDTKSKFREVLFNKIYPIDFHGDLLREPIGYFSQTLIDETITTFMKIKSDATSYNPIDWVGVATESFRLAKNVEVLIRRLEIEVGIKIKIIDQKKEADLAYDAVNAILPESDEQIVVWDIGGGSFQLITRDESGESLQFLSNKASIYFKNQVIKYQKERYKNSPNPLSNDDFLLGLNHIAPQLVEDVPEILRAKLKLSRVYGFGSLFGINIRKLVGRSSFTQKDLEDRINMYRSKTDRQLVATKLVKPAYVDVFISNAVLILGIMKNLDIEKVDVIRGDINYGVLTAKEFWR